MPILKPYSPAEPVAHLHIPKSGGTSLHNALIETLRPQYTACGLGRHHFGTFEDFDTLPAEAANMLLLTPESMHQDATYIGGHIAYTDILERFGTAQVLTVAREPYCRTISQWLFWRAWPWGDRDFWGGWGRVIDHSRKPLRAFLTEAEAASVTDNPFARLLIGDDEKLLPAQFIGPADADHLFERASENLHRFSFVNYAENERFSEELSDWLGCRTELPQDNETPTLAAELGGDLSAELTPETLRLLEERNRIDLRLWAQIVRWSGKDWHEVRTNALCRGLPRFAKLYRGAS